tara:strand:- start:66 stop:221 length:156 start_codon:yes stop_codon:yes gene_type:complete
MKLSEAIKAKDKDAVKKLVQKAMEKLTNDLTNEFFLQREHELKKDEVRKKY